MCATLQFTASPCVSVCVDGWGEGEGGAASLPCSRQQGSCCLIASILFECAKNVAQDSPAPRCTCSYARLRSIASVDTQSLIAMQK